eukprot:5658270-Alexandrium_andersonii.AAC.1
MRASPCPELTNNKRSGDNPSLRFPGVARHHAASRHGAPRVLLRNRALRCALRRKALPRDVR